MKAVLDAKRLHELRRRIAVDQLLDTIVHDEPTQAAGYWMDIYRDRDRDEAVRAAQDLSEKLDARISAAADVEEQRA